MGGVEAGKRVLVRTYGCQMNVHDSEKVTNLLHHHGYAPAGGLDEADLLIINTCSIREKAEHHLYSDLGRLRSWKQADPERILAVGGCVAQQEGEALLRRFGLPTKLPARPRKAYLGALRVDKKSRDSRIRYIALRRIGRAEAVELTPAEILPAGWERC